jgi:excisionase family DNA binding protein
MSTQKNPESLPEILDIEQAAELLGVSLKTFNKVLHTEAVPARKIGREWKFSKAALIEWVGSGRSTEFYREYRDDKDDGDADGGDGRRTAGWKIEQD